MKDIWCDFKIPFVLPMFNHGLNPIINCAGYVKLDAAFEGKIKCQYIRSKIKYSPLHKEKLLFFVPNADQKYLKRDSESHKRVGNSSSIEIVDSNDSKNDDTKENASIELAFNGMYFIFFRTEKVWECKVKHPLAKHLLRTIRRMTETGEFRYKIKIEGNLDPKIFVMLDPQIKDPDILDLERKFSTLDLGVQTVLTMAVALAIEKTVPFDSENQRNFKYTLISKLKEIQNSIFQQKIPISFEYYLSTIRNDCREIKIKTSGKAIFIAGFFAQPFLQNDLNFGIKSDEELFFAKNCCESIESLLSRAFRTSACFLHLKNLIKLMRTSNCLQGLELDRILDNIEKTAFSCSLEANTLCNLNSLTSELKKKIQNFINHTEVLINNLAPRVNEPWEQKEYAMIQERALNFHKILVLFFPKEIQKKLIELNSNILRSFDRKTTFKYFQFLHNFSKAYVPDDLMTLLIDLNQMKVEGCGVTANGGKNSIWVIPGESIDKVRDYLKNKTDFIREFVINDEENGALLSNIYENPVEIISDL